MIGGAWTTAGNLVATGEGIVSSTPTTRPPARSLVVPGGCRVNSAPMSFALTSSSTSRPPAAATSSSTTRLNDAPCCPHSIDGPKSRVRCLGAAHRAAPFPKREALEVLRTLAAALALRRNLCRGCRTAGAELDDGRCRRAEGTMRRSRRVQSEQQQLEPERLIRGRHDGGRARGVAGPDHLHHSGWRRAVQPRGHGRSRPRQPAASVGTRAGCLSPGVLQEPEQGDPAGDQPHHLVQGR